MDAIRERSGIDLDFFISNEPYDDDITFKLAIAVSEEMNMSIGAVLIAFGEVGHENYIRKIPRINEFRRINLKEFFSEFTCIP
jgi:hypothetical protein